MKFKYLMLSYVLKCKKIKKDILFFNSIAILMYYKSFVLKNKNSDIETLIIGSSHAQHSYYATYNKEFNLSFSSMDLYYSYRLYEKYIDKLFNLKQVVLFYSVFSPSYEIVKIYQKYICILFQKFFNINSTSIKQNIFNHVFIILYYFYWLYKKHNLSIDLKYNGNLHKTHATPGYIQLPKACKKEDAYKRAASAYKHNRRNNSQNIFVEKMYSLAKEHNQELVIVLSPASKYYKDAIPDQQVLFEDLFKFTSKNGIKVINLYKDLNLEDEYWFDYDHLNYKGGVIATEMIQKALYN